MRPLRPFGRRALLTCAVPALATMMGALSLVACAPASDGPAAQDRAAVRTGRQLYGQFGCGRCHGSRLEGTRTAPPLTGLGAFWTREGLVGFMRNPKVTMEQVPRLRYLSERFAIDMSAVRADDESLRQLAIFLLAN